MAARPLQMRGQSRAKCHPRLGAFKVNAKAPASIRPSNALAGPRARPVNRPQKSAVPKARAAASPQSAEFTVIRIGCPGRPGLVIAGGAVPAAILHSKALEKFYWGGKTQVAPDPAPPVARALPSCSLMAEVV